MRTDLLVVWPMRGEGEAPRGQQKAVIECKLLRGSLEATLGKGLAQTGEYMARAGTDEGHLVIFDPQGWSDVGREDLLPRGAGGRPANHGLGM